MGISLWPCHPLGAKHLVMRPVFLSHSFQFSLYTYAVLPLHLCCAPSTPQSVSVGPALSLPGFEMVTNGMVKGLHAFYHVITVSLRRQGIWKMASGAADAQESQFYEVSGGFWPLLRKGSVGKTP